MQDARQEENIKQHLYHIEMTTTYLRKQSEATRRNVREQNKMAQRT